MTRRDVVWSYNVDNNRPDQKQLAAETAAILDTQPLALVCLETIGNRMPQIRGYDLLASDVNRSRANVSIYVRDTADRQPPGLRWIDLDTTWPRTDGPGTHEARSFPYDVIDGLLLIGVHQQPQRTQTTVDGQAEGIGALSRTIKAHDGPALAIGDFNRRVYENGPGPRTLANRVGGKVYGQRIDCAVGRGIKARSTYLSKVDGVRLLSDHGHAQRLEVAWESPLSPTKEATR